MNRYRLIYFYDNCVPSDDYVYASSIDEAIRKFNSVSRSVSCKLLYVHLADPDRVGYDYNPHSMF